MTEVDDTLQSVLPWWRNPVNVVLSLVLVIMASTTLGFRWGSENSMVAHNSVDTGFLQDMRIHHTQAVTMAYVYLGVSEADNSVLRTIAREIMFDQSMESGRMVQMLRMFGESETNETDIAMSWMGMPVPLSSMPGYVSDEDIEKLHLARGESSDELFIDLMTAHHEGGIHMAEFAVSHGKNSEVIALAKAMITAQRSEVAELKKLSKS